MEEGLNRSEYFSCFTTKVFEEVVATGHNAFLFMCNTKILGSENPKNRQEKKGETRTKREKGGFFETTKQEVAKKEDEHEETI